MLPVELTELAGLELADAYDWYEDQRLGLGDDLLSEFRAACRRISEYPRSYQVVERIDGREIRRALVRRFPYGAFYA